MMSHRWLLGTLLGLLLLAQPGIAGRPPATTQRSVPLFLVWAPDSSAAQCETTERGLAQFLTESGVPTAALHEVFPEADEWDTATLFLTAALRGVAGIVRVDRSEMVVVGAVTLPGETAPTPLCRMNVEATTTPAGAQFPAWTSGVNLDGACLQPMYSSALESLAGQLSRELVSIASRKPTGQNAGIGLQ